jgi:hypothetical protein
LTVRLSTVKTAFTNRAIVLPALFPRGRPVWRLRDLRIRMQAVRLLARTSHAMYQPIPFPEFADLTPAQNRASEDRWEVMRAVLPDDLSGLRFLDVGAAEGFFSLKCAQEGATVVALERDALKVKLMGLVKSRYGLDNFDPRRVDLTETELRPLGTFDFAFFLNVHQHVYRLDPEAAKRNLTDLGAMCTRGIFLEARPTELTPEVARRDPSKPQPFRHVDDLVEAVASGTGFTEATELHYDANIGTPRDMESVPNGVEVRYRLFYLTRPGSS